MVRLAEIVLAGLVFFTGCKQVQLKKQPEKIQVKKDMYVGNFIVRNKKFPIRQIKFFNESGCLQKSKSGRCLFGTLGDFCGFYVDKNNDGKYNYQTDLRLSKSPCRKKGDPLIKIYSFND